MDENHDGNGYVCTKGVVYDNGQVLNSVHIVHKQDDPPYITEFLQLMKSPAMKHGRSFQVVETAMPVLPFTESGDFEKALRQAGFYQRPHDKPARWYRKDVECPDDQPTLFN